MTEERKPGLGFGADHAVALEAPVKATERHTPHSLDDFTIELDENDDTATIYLSEVDVTSSSIRVTRASMPFPLSMLADLVRRRPMTAAEREEDARAEAEEEARVNVEEELTRWGSPAGSLNPLPPQGNPL